LTRDADAIARGRWLIHPPLCNEAKTLVSDGGAEDAPSGAPFKGGRFMNRFTITIALAVAITSIGCATGVEDTQPEETVEPQQDPPAQLRSGEHQDPLANVVGSVDEIRIDLRLPPKTPLPGAKD
jgi:hypothetical protein